MHYDDADLAMAPGHGRGNLVAGAMQQHIGFGTSKPQPANVQVIEETGQHRMLEADLAPFGIELQSEARLH